MPKFTVAIRCMETEDIISTVGDERKAIALESLERETRDTLNPDNHYTEIIELGEDGNEK